MSGVACHFSTIPKPEELWTSKLSHNVHHTIPCVMCPVSHVRCHMSLVTCHLSLVTCHVSHVRCHMSQFLSSFFLLESGGVSWWRVYCQWGLPRLVFRLFLIKNSLIPKIYLFQLVVVRFWSLKKAN